MTFRNRVCPIIYHTGKERRVSGWFVRQKTHTCLPIQPCTLIERLHVSTGKMPFICFFSLSLQSLLHYGSEVWVLDADHTPVERVHLFALKMFLNASLRTPDLMVYGETGRYPLFVNIYVKCITFWIRILKMPPCRLPFTPYKMLLHLHERNKTTWPSSVCYLLCKYDFGDSLSKSGRWRRKDISKGI